MSKERKLRGDCIVAPPEGTTIQLGPEQAAIVLSPGGIDVYLHHQDPEGIASTVNTIVALTAREITASYGQPCGEPGCTNCDPAAKADRGECN